MLLVTGVVVIARHPIARMLGTEVTDPPVPPAVVASAPPVAGSAGTAPAAAAVTAVPTHAPRDPFRALVGAGGAVLAPEAASAATTTHVGTVVGHHPKHSTRPVAGGSSTCAGTVHAVVAGDTLWTIAARAVKSGNSNTVTIAWHRIYRANRPPLSNPGMLPVGTKLCLPASL